MRPSAADRSRLDLTRAVESRAALTDLRIPAFLTAVLAAACIALPAAGAERASGSDRAAIFYYPWYSTPTKDGRWAHWYVDHDGTTVLSTPYLPTRGLYSSSNARTVLAQMREIAATGVGTVVVSWWGFDSPEHERLALVRQAAARYGLELAIHVEPYRGRTPARAAEDIVRLHSEGGFVDFYVYDVDRDPAAAWARHSPRSRTFGSSDIRRSSGVRRRRASTVCTRTTSSRGTARFSSACARRPTLPDCSARPLGHNTYTTKAAIHHHSTG